MKILYGVTGEGMGHAMRSRVILDHLVSGGHEIAVMASGRAFPYLANRFAGVNRIHGLHMVFDANRIDVRKTLVSNALGGLRGIPTNVSVYIDLVRRFRPDVVISDFESWTYLYAKAHRLPILSLDNMQILNRCEVPGVIVSGYEAQYRLTRAFVASKLPLCDDYFVTTFFRPPLRASRTRLFPPILRPEVLFARPRRGAHLVVYQSGGYDPSLARILGATGIECRIYGMVRGLAEERVEGNLRHQPLGEARFVDDLASCRGVIANGGFTLMGEAIHLKKPMLAVPIARQFEQLLNARYLAAEGYGRFAECIDDIGVVRDFVSSLSRYDDRLHAAPSKGNHEIIDALDEWLDDAVAPARRAAAARMVA